MRQARHHEDQNYAAKPQSYCVILKPQVLWSGTTGHTEAISQCGPRQSELREMDTYRCCCCCCCCCRLACDMPGARWPCTRLPTRETPNSIMLGRELTLPVNFFQDVKAATCPETGKSLHSKFEWSVRISNSLPCRALTRHDIFAGRLDDAGSLGHCQFRPYRPETHQTLSVPALAT